MPKMFMRMVSITVICCLVIVMAVQSKAAYAYIENPEYNPEYILSEKLQYIHSQLTPDEQASVQLTRTALALLNGTDDIGLIPSVWSKLETVTNDTYIGSGDKDAITADNAIALVSTFASLLLPTPNGDLPVLTSGVIDMVGQMANIANMGDIGVEQLLNWPYLADAVLDLEEAIKFALSDESDLLVDLLLSLMLGSSLDTEGLPLDTNAYTLFDLLSFYGITFTDLMGDILLVLDEVDPDLTSAAAVLSAYVRTESTLGSYYSMLGSDTQYYYPTIIGTGFLNSMLDWHSSDPAVEITPYDDGSIGISIKETEVNKLIVTTTITASFTLPGSSVLPVIPTMVFISEEVTLNRKYAMKDVIKGSSISIDVDNIRLYLSTRAGLLAEEVRFLLSFIEPKLQPK